MWLGFVLPEHDRPTPRYAVYFSPSDASQLGVFGARVLQRTACDNDHPMRLSVTEKPAHYGFHATFKAPMELAEGCTGRELLEAVRTFCTHRQRVPLSGLKPEMLNGFHALRLPESPVVDDFAAEVMRAFERFRAPLSDADRQRRNPKSLTERQNVYLERYGYPHVLEEFNFHMTLSQRMQPGADSEGYHRWLTELFERKVTQTAWLDQLAVFFQPDRSSAFTRIAEFPVD